MQGDIHHQEWQEDEEGGLNCANQWDCRYVLKEMLMNALGLRVIGKLIADNEAMTDDNISEVNENNKKPI